MVTVFLRGGLGNQMFEYACGLNLAKKNNAGLAFDATFLQDRFPRKEFTYRSYDLDVFGIEPNYTVLSKASQQLPIPGFWLGADLAVARVKDAMGLRKMVLEKQNLVFDPEVLQAKDNILLYGFWQSEKYFKENADAVRAAFTFKRPLEGDAMKIAGDMRNSNSVALHVRRGDNIVFQSAKKLFGETSVSYYDRALAYVAERVPDLRVFIFSDDLAWCRENIHPAFPTVYLDDTTSGFKASGHLELMSLCKHTIIANSTFSWWAGWLNANPKKIVVAPAQWHVSTNSNGPLDIIPSEWIKI